MPEPHATTATPAPTELQPPRARSAVNLLWPTGLSLIAALCLWLGLQLEPCARANDFYTLTAGEATLAALAFVWRRGGWVLLGVGSLAIALSLPRLMTGPRACSRERVVKELQALGVAQQRYAEANGGHYEGDLGCLSSPGDCLGSGRRVDTGLAAVEPCSSSRGYRFTFTPGPPPDPLDPELSPTSVTAWACTAAPERRRPGFDGFCLDSEGVFCATLDGSTPAVTDEAGCDTSVCTPLS